ncbi:MAG: NAD-dependent epimerase/dehydratase family protein, partial [Myxococcota bacterium]|nr:NAD-dependent epimerase/dehydratase family protein [Myxococcota bacterium]
RVRAAAEGCHGAFHCAGKVSRDPADAEELYRVHVEGTKNVLDSCARAGVRRVVVASTSGTVAVSETAERVATEDDPTPIGILSRWPYYRAKLFAERAALERNRPGFEVVAINPSLLLGPGDARGSSTEDVRLLLEGAIRMVPAGGLSFVDARDAADAMRLAMERGRAGERYLIGACNLTVRDFFARLGRVSGVRTPWVPMPRSRQLARVGATWMQRVASRVGFDASLDPVSVEMAQCFWYLDSSKAERELGWSTRDPNLTLHETVEDLRARGVVWPRGDDRGDGRPRWTGVAGAR